MPQEATAQVVRNLPRFEDPNLLVGAEHFSDAGVYRLRDDLAVVQTLDFFPPLVDDPYQFGRIAAANALSDLFAMGARPITALNIVGFPDDKLPLEVLSDILRGGSERVAAAGAVILGGHSVRDSEVKYGLAVTGTVHPEQLFDNAGAQAGDRLVLTKALGTGFITTAAKAGRCPEQVLQQAIASMVELNQQASQLAREHHAHAVTDITGFGLGGHACEMALASGVTFQLEVARLPELPGAVELAQRGFRTRASESNRRFLQQHMQLQGEPDSGKLELLFDAQTSGGLLVSLPESQAESYVEACHREGILAACIVGQVLPRSDQALVVVPGA